MHIRAAAKKVKNALKKLSAAKTKNIAQKNVKKTKPKKPKQNLNLLSGAIPVIRGNQEMVPLLAGLFYR
jgi:hypothetical protein